MKISPNDSLLKGCAVGFACQIGFWLLGSFLAFQADEHSKWPSILFVSWGLTQWTALVPLILRQKAMNHPNTVQGLLIAGSVGVLLSSACAGMMFLGK